MTVILIGIALCTPLVILPALVFCLADFASKQEQA